MEAIPVPIRKRIMALYGQGKKTTHISAALGYCVAAVRRVRQQFKQRGTLEPQTHLCGPIGLFTTQRREHLLRLLAEKPDSTLAELSAQMDRPVAVSTMHNWVRLLNMSFKKSRSAPPSRSGRTSPRSGLAGTSSSRASRRKTSSSSMNQGSRAT
jgi:transposase